MDDYPTIERRSGTKSTLTAFFDDRVAAERAVERMRNAGVPDASIRLTEGGRPDAQSEHQGSEGRGFFEKLADFFFPDDDRSVYAEGLARGGYLVTATRLSPELYDTALDILDADGAVDIEERSATWRTEGWTGNYTDLHDPESLLRARADHVDLSNVAKPRGNDRGELSSYDAELSANLADDTNGTQEQGREPSPAAAGMAAAVSGVLLGSHSSARAHSESQQRTMESESAEVIEARRYGKRDMSHGRTRVRSYVLDDEDGDTDNERAVETIMERDINRP